jgi:hypothetical protein
MILYLIWNQDSQLAQEEKQLLSEAYKENGSFFSWTQKKIIALIEIFKKVEFNLTEKEVPYWAFWQSWYDVRQTLAWRGQ